MTPPQRWVRPLFGITGFIASTSLRYHIIAVYHHCFSPRTMASFYHHCCWLLHFDFFYVITPQRWFQPLIQIAACIGSTLLIDCIIAIYHHCFSTSTMVLFHHCRCWLLFFDFFKRFLRMYYYYQSLISLVTLEWIFWEIISSLYLYHDHWFHLKYSDEQFNSNFYFLSLTIFKLAY